ncbi:hypothetical protein PPYR_09097 [Photinus pyralis]|uniref:C2 domain-containing protein n=2 Tax=Photinus pyralis TaxID=7054 RepID=A0A1Y1LA05_PHOPY|nr:coiled-coil and C2 domain-containing protein 1-like isoform X1 [Photinus pyralis]XP_031344781.1 coiled-coil and C2 domain-containing protein 1-like isoform X1 [Photinus pyralis]KAB0797547.1 hypothetical protein PPYR_08540 [Photinus pyralis]KAB0798104.1 hypothetical protein PPYR_09097 [Photinus pyralis]
MSAKTKRDRSNRDLSQYGIFGIPSMDNGDNDDDGNDSDLEAELLALAGGKQKRAQRKKPAPVANLDVMIAASLRDIPSDEELSGDDDDPDLLNELSQITGDEPEPDPTPKSPEPQTDIMPLLQSRLKMYETAEANATQSGETSRVRRLGRGIKTLKDLIKQASGGRGINRDDIPPEVAVTVKPKPVENEQAQPTRPAPTSPLIDFEAPPPVEQPSPEISPSGLSPENEELLKLLNSRKDEYKMAALQAKRGGNGELAMKFIKTAKQFELVIKAVESGQPVDLSLMPGPPAEEVAREESEVQKRSDSAEEPTEDSPKPALITASSVGEALQQRLEVYQKQEESAKEQGNASKARRMGRIVKQFQDAIKLHNAGKPVPVDELPTPPGYGPIPVPAAAKPVEPPKPQVPERVVAPKPSPSQPKIVKKNSALSRIDKQVEMLKARQKEFKDAALNAKKKGELEQAKEYLRTAKGFDPLIDAAQGGLPVDIATLPVPPSVKSQLDEEYGVVLAEEVEEGGEIDPEHLDILTRLEQQLTKQLKMALSTRDHNKAIGDVAGMNRFEHLALSVTRDLDIIRIAKRKHTSQLPKFHYETKNFSIVKSFTELNDNDLQLTILRGINYNCSNPDSIDTYVKFEFPFPQEEPVRNKTAVVKDTNNPQYDETFTLPIQRTARPCLRVFKRQSVKLEVYSKGCIASDWACCFSGFFRGDTLLGTVTVKLQPLETRCELHESFDLVDGRKKVGGKLEVRLRVRDPLVTRQIEQLSEKWLVLDH